MCNKVSQNLLAQLIFISTCFDDSHYDSDDYESLFIEIHVLRGKHIDVGIVYRQPQSGIKNFIETFDNCLKSLSNENKLAYEGDYNINVLMCTKQYVNELLNIVFLFYLSSFEFNTLFVHIIK